MSLIKDAGQQNGPGISIKSLLVAALASLSLLALTGFGWSAVQAWRDHEAAKQTAAFDAGVNDFSAGLFEVLMERLYTNNGLQAPGPADGALLREIEARRKIVREKYEPGLAVLKASRFPGKDALLGELEGAGTKANQYRAQADRALGQPRDQRDETLLKTFVPTITASVNASLKVWFSALHETAKVDPKLAQLAAIKEIGWRMRDVAGSERSTVSQAIAAGTRISPDNLAAITSVRARVDLLWQQLESLTLAEDTHPAIKRAMAGAREQYFGHFRKLSDDMRKVSDAGGEYNMPVTRFVETTTTQLGALIGVMYAAAEASEAHGREIRADALSSMAWGIALIGLSILIAVGTFMLVARRVVRPLHAMTGVMQKLTSGDLTAEITGQDRNDEIGAMAKATQVFKDGLIAAERLRAEQQAEQQHQIERGRKIERSVAGFEKAISEVVSIVSSTAADLQTAAKTMSTGAEETTRQSTNVAAASQRASENVQTVASATQELSASVNEISQRVIESNRMIDEAVSQANGTNEQVRGLDQSAQRIGDVVKIINDIAGQTNLLALNATIEAARAGEAGKGFAVVASEVKALANQTAKATEEIAAQIKTIQEATQTSVHSIQKITGTIGKMSETATSIASAVEQQGSATQEIARNVEQAAQGTRDVSTSVDSVSQVAISTGTVAATVLASATELSKNSVELKQQVESFLREVRAA